MRSEPPAVAGGPSHFFTFGPPATAGGSDLAKQRPLGRGSAEGSYSGVALAADSLLIKPEPP
jgi:hypothetical protein